MSFQAMKFAAPSMARFSNNPHVVCPYLRKLAKGAGNNDPTGTRVWVQAQPAAAIHGWIAIFNG